MNYLTYLNVWNKLDISQQNQLTKSSVIRKFHKDEILYKNATDCTGLILVISGQLRAYTISENGREITLYRLFSRVKLRSAVQSCCLLKRPYNSLVNL